MRKGSTYSDQSAAFEALRSRLPGYSYPPKDSDLENVGRIADHAFLKKLVAAAIALALTAFGVFYVLKPEDAFRLAARAVFFIAPFAWFAAIAGIIGFSQEQRQAEVLRDLWKDWVRREPPNSD